MAKISPFRGIRYNIDKITDLSSVTTPPYDVISPQEQKRYYELHENNIIRIELGKDFEDDNETNNKYTRAGEYLNKWIENQVLIQEEAPAVYIYEQEFPISEWESKTRRGLVCTVKLAEFSEKVVLPHEFTLSKAKVDRFNLMSSTNANISQIFCLYNDTGKIAPVLDNYTAAHLPENSYENSNGITERLWVVTEPEIIAEICSNFSDKQLFIADGHHRYETALNFQKKSTSENPSHTGDEPYNYVMMTLVDMNDPGLVIFPTHRAVRIEPFDSEDFLKFAGMYFKIDKINFNTSNDLHNISNQIKTSLEQNGIYGKTFGYYDGLGKWYYILTLKDSSLTEKFLPDKSPAFKDLDVAVLHSIIMEEYFKINSDNLANQTSLSYIKDIHETLCGVDSHEYQCAFFLNPTRIDQLKEVSLANEKMPQKSTYFYPKLTTGLVLNKFK